MHPFLPREAACNQSQLFPFIHDKIFVWIQKKESQGCHTAGNLSTIGFLLYDSALCLDPHMESSLTDFVYHLDETIFLNVEDYPRLLLCLIDRSFNSSELKLRQRFGLINHPGKKSVKLWGLFIDQGFLGIG